MKYGIFLFLILGLVFAGMAFAVQSDLGTFSCPSGQVEDLQCAAQCCQGAGGTYSYSDETCVVTDSSDWNSAMSCEQQQNCCKSAGASNPTSSGCCASAALIGLVCVGAFMNRNGS
jgi:hypothetical protein